MLHYCAHTSLRTSHNINVNKDNDNPAIDNIALLHKIRVFKVQEYSPWN